MSALRKNVASQVLTFNLVNATTGAALTSASVTTKVALDGTQSGGAGTVTELGTGQYKYVPTQGETNGTTAGFSFTATNAVPVNLHCFITALDPTDAVRGGMTALPNAAAEAAGGLYTRGAGAGQLSQSANGELGVATLTKTLTTYTSNTPQTGDAYAVVNSGTFGNAAIKTALDALVTTVGVAGAGLTATATAVWSVATRILTAGTNIVLAKGTGVTGFNDISATDVWAAGTRTLTSFGTLAADAATAVWGAVTRSLTDKTDFALTSAYDSAKTAAQAGDAMTLTAAYDAAKTAATQTSVDAVPTAADTADAVWEEAIADHDGTPGSTAEALQLAAAGGSVPTADQNADALLDRVNGIETGLTPRNSLRLIAAALAGKLTGAATTTVTIRNAEADSKNRIVATVDSNGNRTAITTDLS